jgi:uncharacterized protein YxeA
MKKIYFMIVAFVALIIGSTVNTVLNFPERDKKSSLILSNIDAASAEEGTEGSNNSGTGNIYYYTNKLGNPKSCTLYLKINASGSIQIETPEGGLTSAEINAGWTITRVSGIVETCPKSGNGCTVYSCHKTTNTY